MTRRGLPALGLDVVDVGMLALPDRLHDLADVHAILDHRVPDGHVLQRHLVADRDVLAALELDSAVLVENESGQRRSRLDAFDDDDGDAVVRVMQYAVDHGSSWAESGRLAARGTRRGTKNREAARRVPRSSPWRGGRATQRITGS